MKVRSRLSWGRLQALKQPPDPPTSSFIMAKEAEISEMMLAQRAGRGDMAARKAIYTLHVRYLAAVCGRYVADSEDARDVLQESFVKIFGAIASFKDRGGQGSLRAWMARIVVNEALRFIRQSQRITFTELGDADGFDPPDDSAPPTAQYPPRWFTSRYVCCPMATGRCLTSMWSKASPIGRLRRCWESRKTHRLPSCRGPRPSSHRDLKKSNLKTIITSYERQQLA